MTITRKKIRNTTTLLLTGTTDAGDNVRASRIIPNKKEDLPAINVYTVGELVVNTGESPKQNKRDIDLVIEITTRDADNDAEASDKADDIAEQVEQILFAEDANRNGKLGCLVNAIDLAGVSTEYESRGESAVNSLRLQFKVEYYKYGTDIVEGNVTEFNRFGVDWDVGTAADPDPEASDLIEIPAVAP